MKSTLDKYLDNVKFIHINNVVEAFELCENFDDVQKVLGEIPNKFGSFSVMLMDDYGKLYDPCDPVAEEKAQIITGFQIVNSYVDENDDYQEDTWDFDWYEG